MPGGRPPTPTRLKILHGNPGKRALNQNEPQYATEKLTCPRWLNKVARAEWRRVRQAMPDRLVTEGDRAALAAYCQAWARWQEAEQALEAAGSLTHEEPVLDKKGEVVGSKIRARPEVSIAAQYHRLMLAAAAKFGMDPSSRSKIKMPEQQTDDPFAAYLAQQKASSG